MKTKSDGVKKFITLAGILTAFLLMVYFTPQQAKAAGTTYYVDSANGNDANSGTDPAAPWKTANKVNNSSFVPGDTVLFKRGGLWRETLSVSGGGAAGAPITYGAYGSGPLPIFSGADVVSNFTAESVHAFYMPLTVQPNQAFLDGSRMALAASKDALATDMWWWDSANRRMYVYDDPSSHTIEASQRQYAIYSQCSYWTYVTFSDLEADAAQDKGLYVCGPVDHFMVTDVTAQKNFMGGIRFDGAKNSVISSSTVAYNGADGINFYETPNLLIDKVVAHDNAQLDTLEYTAGIKGVDSYRGSTNVIIQNSLSYANGIGKPGQRGSGIWIDTIGNGAVIRYNTVHDNNVRGLDIDADNNVTIYGNVSYSNESGIMAYADAEKTMNGISIFNNTVFGNRIAGVELIGPSAGSAPSGCTNNLVRNNITVATTNGPNLAAFLGCENPGVNGSGNDYTYNDYGPQSAKFIQWGGDFGAPAYLSSYASWEAAYCGASGCSHSVQADPAFVNPGAGNFALQAASPAVDAGLNLGPNYQMGLDPSSAWPAMIVTVNQNSYGPAWELGAFVFTRNPALPQASLVSPSSGATLSNQVTLSATATASSPATLVAVNFYLDGSLLAAATSTSAPSFIWNSASVANGSHNLYAEATDSYGNKAISAAVTVLVNNQTSLPLPLISSFTASPASIASGGSSALSWSVSNATSLSIDQSVGSVTGLTAKTVSPTVTTIYTLTATNGSGSAMAQATVTVTAPVLPAISNLQASNLTASSTTISWQTNVPTTGQVFYGTSTAYGLSSTLLDSNPLALAHSTALTNLSPSTLYHFKVTSIDASNNSASSPDFTFITLALPLPPATTPASSPPSGSSGSGAGGGSGGGSSGSGAGNSSSGSSSAGGGGSSPVTVYIPPTISTPPAAASAPASLPKLKLINSSGTYYLIIHGVRHGITLPGLLFSYGFALSQAKPATAADLALPEGNILSPNDGMLVKTAKNKTVWLISNSQRRGFTSEKVFSALGFKFSQILTVTAPELNRLPLGLNLSNPKAAHSPGINIQDKGSIYWIDHNYTRHPYPSVAVFNSWNVPNDFTRVLPANAADRALPIAEPVQLRVVE